MCHNHKDFLQHSTNPCALHPPSGHWSHMFVSVHLGMLSNLDERLWGAIEENELRKQFLFERELSTLANHVNVKAELQQDIRVRQFNKHDLERKSLDPHPDKTTDHKNEGNIKTNDPTK